MAMGFCLTNWIMSKEYKRGKQAAWITRERRQLNVHHGTITIRLCMSTHEQKLSGNFASVGAVLTSMCGSSSVRPPVTFFF